MAFNHSPQIVKDGLVLYLDARSPKSYGGSGTTWIDRSGNGNTGTLSNGASFSDGYMALDGTNDYILANNTSLNSLFTTTSVSHFIWFYPTSRGQIVSELGQTTINSNWHDSNIEINTNGAFSFSTWHGSLTNRVVSSNQSFNKWYHVGFSYNGTTLFAYINGVLVGTTNFTRQAPYLNGQQTHYALCAQDGTNMGTNAFAGGRVGAFNVYNRSLSQNEILQNYNATKGRYGL